MISIRLLSVVALAGAVVVAGPGCGDNGSEPSNTGPVTVSLVTPNADDGALLLTVVGPAGLSAVQGANSAYRVYWRLATATETRVIVVGNIVAGPIFTATAPTGLAASEFTVSVTEVATRADALRASTAGYSLGLTRQ